MEQEKDEPDIEPGVLYGFTNNTMPVDQDMVHAISNPNKRRRRRRCHKDHHNRRRLTQSTEKEEDYYYNSDSSTTSSSSSSSSSSAISSSLKSCTTDDADNNNDKMLIVSSAIRSMSVTGVSPVSMTITPQPQQQQISPYEWCVCERNPEVVRRAFWMMDLQEPREIDCVIDINMPNSNHYIGCQNIFNIISSKILKPRSQMEMFLERARSMTHPLNFVIIGPNGSGRRRAIRLACSQTNICTVTICREKYEPNFLTMATQYAYSKRPFLLLIDNLNELMDNTDFMKEFDSVVLKNSLFTGGWCNVWLVITLSSISSEVMYLISKVCSYDNIAFMEQPTARKLHDFLITYIEEHNMTIPDLNDCQFNRLLEAVKNATPADVAHFGDRVITSALDHTSFEDLAKYNGKDLATIDYVTTTTTTLSQQEPPLSSLSSQQLLPIQKTEYALRRRRQQQQEQQMPIQGSLSHPLSSLSSSSSSSSGLKQQQQQQQNRTKNNPLVNWERDAESKYITPMSLGLTGQPIDARVIPYNILQKYLKLDDLTNIKPW